MRDDSTLSTDRESLSALMDGEANDLDVARALRAVVNSSELRTYWRRQHMVREAMSGQVVSTAAVDVSDGVRLAVASEKRRYANPLISMAVAASVTVAVVLGGQALCSMRALNPVISCAIVQVPGSGRYKQALLNLRCYSPDQRRRFVSHTQSLQH